MLKEPLRKLATIGSIASGMTWAGRKLTTQNGTLILYGHRVSDDDEGYMQGLPPKHFADQITYLTRHYEIIPLETLIQCLEERKEPPERSVVLTFDDGFKDNLENMYPILEAARIPATIFLVTNSIETGMLPWSQRLGFLFQNTDRKELADPLLNDPKDISTPRLKRICYNMIKASLKTMRRKDREANLLRLSQALDQDPPTNRMLSWADARHLMANRVGIGAHTFSHPLLAMIPSDEATEELQRSKQDLADKLGINHPNFCFPAGSQNDWLRAELKRLGYRSAFLPGQEFRWNNPNVVDVFTMSRVGLPNAPASNLEAELNGPIPIVRSFVRRRLGQL